MKNLGSISLAFALAALVSFGVAFSDTSARANSVNAAGTELNFSNTVARATNATIGTSISYSNVLSGVDARVVYVSTNKTPTFITAFDKAPRADMDVTALDLQFNTGDGTATYPWGTLADPKGNLGHEIKFRIDFFVSGTNTPIQLTGFSVLAVDVDCKQGASFKGATSGVTATSSTLVKEVTADGIKIRDTSGNDATTADKLFWGSWIYDAPVTTVEFTLISGFSGANAFPLQFKTVDWAGLSATATYAPPVAANDSYTTAFDAPVNGVAGTGDSYPSGSVFAQTSQPANGSVVWNNDGTYIYTPTAGFSGSDSFTYEITAPDGQKVSATQLITVQAAVATPTPAPTQAAVAPPIAVNDTYSTALNTPVSGAAGTGDTFAAGSVFARTSQPANGSVVWNADGTYTYTPNNGFSGVDSFTYEITAPDGQKSSATQFITIQAAIVTPVPAPTLAPVQPVTPVAPVVPPRKPAAAPDYKSGKQNQETTLVPVSNDTPGDVELVPTSIALCGSACELLTSGSPDHASLQAKPVVTEQGTWKIDLASGNVIFTPAKNWFGTASIEYIMFDAAGNQVKSTLSIDIPNEIVDPVEEELAYTGVDELPATIAVSIALIALGLVLRRRFIQN